MVEHLSVTAAARRDAALPGLLVAVRRRRRRRQAVRAVAALLLTAVGVWGWQRVSAPPMSPTAPPVADAPRWQFVPTDPTLAARCTVATAVRPEWFVDDAGLQELLAADDRPDGLVRVGDRVLVSPAAVDPFPLQP